jgi:SAM-dependent methyltransferase
MFLGYQPHLHEQQKRIEKEAAKDPTTPDMSTISTASSSLKSKQRPSTSSSIASIRQPSLSSRSAYSKDDSSIATPTPPSGNGVFSKKRFRRPKTSGGAESTLASLAQFNSFDSTPSASRYSRQLDYNNVGSTFLSSQRGGQLTSDRMLGRGNDFSAAQKRAAGEAKDASKYNYDSGIPLNIRIPSSAGYSEVSNLSIGTAASPDYLEHNSWSGRAAGLNGLGISSEQPESQQEYQFDLSHYPLPVRLGLIHPSQLSRSDRKRLCRPKYPLPLCTELVPLKRKQAAQYRGGYFLSTPPPSNRETRLKSPRGSDHPRADSFAQYANRTEILRRLGSSKGREKGDTNSPEMLRRRSTRMASGDVPPRWKIDQYFVVHKIKVGMQTREYKHHTYSREEAPYWWGYNTKTLTSELLHHDLVTAMIGLSVVDWKGGVPRRVLDIGTGTGSWVVEYARQWKQTEFIGLDLVPVQTPLQNLQDEDLQSRVSWVVANALQGLPFPDNSFDFIHIRMLNSGVPEDRWEFVLTEVLRVLAPAGRLEVSETDWNFFGSPKEMSTKDLQFILSGQPRVGHTDLSLLKRKDGDRYHDLGAAVTAMVARRLIKFDPAPLVPFHLSALEYSNIGQGIPRHLPILARSSTYVPKKVKDEGLLSSTPPYASTYHVKVEVTEHSLASRTQIGNPLAPHAFKIPSMDTFRMAILVAETTRISEARTLIWQETQNDPNTCQWRNFTEFNHDIEEWYRDMIDRGDLEALLKSLIDWNEGASRMDSNMQLERETREEEMRSLGRGATGLNVKSRKVNGPGFLPLSTNMSSASSVIEDNEDHNDGSDNNDESEAHRDDAPFTTPPGFKETTPILVIRTGAIFTAQKRESSVTV